MTVGERRKLSRSSGHESHRHTRRTWKFLIEIYHWKIYWELTDFMSTAKPSSFSFVVFFFVCCVLLFILILCVRHPYHPQQFIACRKRFKDTTTADHFFVSVFCVSWFLSCIYFQCVGVFFWSLRQRKIHENISTAAGEEKWGILLCCCLSGTLSKWRFNANDPKGAVKCPFSQKTGWELDDLDSSDSGSVADIIGNAGTQKNRERKRRKGRVKFRLSSIKRPTPSLWSMALFLSSLHSIHDKFNDPKYVDVSPLWPVNSSLHPHFIGLCCFNPVLLVEKVLFHDVFFFGSFERMLLAGAELSIESLNLSPPTYYVTPPHRSSIHEFLLSSSHVQHYRKIRWK